jgi:Protein of unknown function (DUF3300)
MQATLRNAVLALLLPLFVASGPFRMIMEAGAAAAPASTAALPEVAPLPPADAASAPASTDGTFDAARLEQLVAPIALYPDALLSQVLMASTYPLEVVEADRWLAKNPGLKDAALDTALKDQDWDPSIKALMLVPDVLKRMSENIDWTKDLGDAFLAQKTEVMDTVQRMRGKAYEAGNLKSTKEQVVTQQQDKIIVIEQAAPEVVYVPTYNTAVVYGPSWYYPSYYYPSMYYYPPGAALFTFSVGVAFGAAIWGGCNWGWGGGDVNIDIDRYNEFNRNTSIDRGDRNQINTGDRGGGKGNWQHDASHRDGVNYRDSKTASQYGRGEGGVSRDQARGRSSPSAGTRDLSGGGAGGATRDLSGGGASAGTRDVSGGGGSRDLSTGASAGTRDLSSGSGNRSSTGASAGSRDLSSSSAARSSSMDRSASSRGASSRGTSSFGGSRGGARGGGGGRRR